MLEFFALEQALSHCIKNDISTTTNNIAIIYNAMVEVVSSQDCALPIGEMSLDKIDTFLREHEYNREFF